MNYQLTTGPYLFVFSCSVAEGSSQRASFLTRPFAHFERACLPFTPHLGTPDRPLSSLPTTPLCAILPPPPFPNPLFIFSLPLSVLLVPTRPCRLPGRRSFTRTRPLPPLLNQRSSLVLARHETLDESPEEGHTLGPCRVDPAEGGRDESRPVSVKPMRGSGGVRLLRGPGLSEREREGAKAVRVGPRRVGSRRGGGSTRAEQQGGVDRGRRMRGREGEGAKSSKKKQPDGLMVEHDCLPSPTVDIQPSRPDNARRPRPRSNHDSLAPLPHLLPRRQNLNVPVGDRPSLTRSDRLRDEDAMTGSSSEPRSPVGTSEPGISDATSQSGSPGSSPVLFFASSRECSSSRSTLVFPFVIDLESD